MNDYDIARAVRRYATHPILGPASRTLANLRDAANHNSDGWAYWPKPARAAAKLMEMIERDVMIERDGTWQYFNDPARADVTSAEYKAALRPIRAFRTRSGIAFDIEEES